ncbi:hypothetical protein B0H17DRAFT_1215668, partial [Mycena rosella]
NRTLGGALDEVPAGRADGLASAPTATRCPSTPPPIVNPASPVINPAPSSILRRPSTLRHPSTLRRPSTPAAVINPVPPVNPAPPVDNPEDEAEGNGDVNPDAFSLDFPQGLLSFDDKEEEDEGKEERRRKVLTGVVDENDGSARSSCATRAHMQSAEQKTAVLKEGQVKARRKGMKEAVETLHKYVKTHAEKIAKTFGLSKAEVRGVIMSATKLKRPQAYHEFNAKVWQTCREHNAGKPKGKRIGMMEGRAIAGKVTGTRKTNAQATKDMTLTGDRVFKELLRLEKRTGARGFCIIAGSHASDTIRSSVIGSVDSVRFLPDVFPMDSGTFATKYRNWSCFDADVQAAKEEMHPGKKVYVSATLRDKFWEASGKPKLDVQFVRYEELMRGKEGYEIVGWPDNVPICAPSNMGIGSSAAIDTLYEHLKNGECYWRAVDPAVHAEINKVFAEAGKKKPRRKRVAAKADDSDDAEETEEEEEAPPLKKRKKPAASEDEEEEEALPKKKAVKRKRAQEEEEEAPPRKKAVKKKKVPVVEDEEEEETPKEKARKKKAAAKEKKGKGKEKEKEKEKEVREKRKRVGPTMAMPPQQRDDADVTDGEPAQSSLTAAGPSISATASASTSKAAASSFTTGWESVRVTDEIPRSRGAAAGQPKAKPKLTAKSLQEIADQDYGSSEED